MSVIVMLFVIGVDSVVCVGDVSSSITERFTFNDDLLSALIPEALRRDRKQLLLYEWFEFFILLNLMGNTL